MADDLLPEGERPAAPERGGLNVRAERCERCLFGPRPHLPRRQGLAKCRNAVNQGRHFTCHEFSNVMCAGFYAAFGDRLWYVTAAKAMRAVILI